MFLNFWIHRANLRGNNFLSKSGAGGFRLAFCKLHKQCGVQFDPEFNSELKEIFKGLLRGHADKKQKGWTIGRRQRPNVFQII